MSASSAKKPAQGTAGARRTRTVSLTDVRCNIANCNYSAKTTKTVENHRLKTHGVAADKSVMDQSVSASILTDSGALSDGSLELKTSTEIYNDMTKVKQSTQLAESDESDRKRRRSSEDDEDADKKLKLGAQSQSFPLPQSQSQATLERQVLVKEALASAKKRTDELNVSESLLEETSLVREFLTDFSQSSSSVTDTMLTAREDHYTNNEELEETRIETDAADSNFSLDQTNGNIKEEELRDMAKELKLRTESLKDALAQVANLESKVSMSGKEKEYLTAKMETKDSEIRSLTEAIKIMKTSLDQPTDNSKDQRKVTSLNAKKIFALEKKITESKEETVRLRESAESSQSILSGMRATQADLLSQITRIKKQTLCLDENCVSDKACGQSHSKKEENRGNCRYFLHGDCNKGNECTYKHDAAAKSNYHIEVEKKKKEKEEKEVEMAKKKAEDEEKKAKEDKEVNKETEKKEKRDKAKQKRKRKRDQRKAGTKGNSSPMDIDGNLSPNSSESKQEQVAKKTKKSMPSKSKAATGVQANRAQASTEGTSNSQTHSNSHIPLPNPNQASFNQPPPNHHNHHHHLNIPPPPIHNFQHSIPNSFNFTPTPSPLPPFQLPLGGQGHGLGTLGGENPWPVVNQTQLGIEMMRRQEAIQAQTLNRNARLNILRSELSSVQERIHNSRTSHIPGTNDLGSLMAAEQNLKQKLYEVTYLGGN